MKKGKLKNQYLLDYTHCNDWEEDEEEKKFNEILMLKAYLQIMCPDFEDKTLYRILNEDPDYILYSLVCNVRVIMDVLLG